jgi:hypothetical protein
VDAVRRAERVGAREPVDPGSDRDGAGADDQLLVADRLLPSGRIVDDELVAFDLDPACDRVEA